MSKETGGPAFPLVHQIASDKPGFDAVKVYDGMTLRDYFAATALPACYTQVVFQCRNQGWGDGWRVEVAEDAYRIADAMLAERNKQ